MKKIDKFGIDDTIVGVATPAGGSISIIRISGDNAVDILRSIFQAKVQSFESHRVYYGWVVDGDGALVDEVLATVMLAPRTFTRQDVVEINCHGSQVVIQKIVMLILEQGARLAQAGEFTKRAFLSGRIDLSKAEAVMDIVNATTDLSHKVAINHLRGRLSNLLGSCCNNLLNLLARIEMSLDYPEHEEADIIAGDIKVALLGISLEIDKLISTAGQGRLIKEGVSTAILGRPNAGKSSLLNALLGEERAIVTHIAGTTRDTLKEHIKIGNIFLNISDTAGIREDADEVEKLGVARSIKEGQGAELLLLVFDGSKPFMEGAFDMEGFGGQKIVVINKTDLPRKLELAGTPLEDLPVVEISAKNHQGIEELKTKIQEIFAINDIEVGQDVVTSARHISLLQDASIALGAAVNAIDGGVFIDLVAIDIMEAYANLGEITGATIDEDLIERIFAEFCLGK